MLLETLSRGKQILKNHFGESQFYINDVSHIKSFAKFTGKHLRQSLFFNKIKGLRHETFLPKRLRHRYFPVNFANLL